MRPGFYGLEWQSGHAIAGPVLASDENTVTRRLEGMRGYLVAGLEVSVESHVFSGDPGESRGLPYKTVSVDGELGPMPAWWIPAGGGDRQTATGTSTPLAARTQCTDGRRTDVGDLRARDQRRSTGRPAPRPAAAAGRPAIPADHLPGGPRRAEQPRRLPPHGADGVARPRGSGALRGSHGARRLILIGYSMGGSLVDPVHAALAPGRPGGASGPRCPGALLAGDPRFQRLRDGAARLLAAQPVEWAIGARIDADWDDLNALRHSEDFHLPILLFHGLDDELVPIETSDELAAEIPQWVTYYRVPDAGHTQSWNVDPALYERRVARFLRSLCNGEQRKAWKSSRARPVGPGSTK